MLTPDLARRYLGLLRDCDSALPAAHGVRQAGRLGDNQYSGVAGRAVTPA